MRRVIALLAGLTIGAITTITTVGAIAALAAPRAATAPRASAANAPSSWPMFLHDLGRSDYDPAERAITPGNVRTLTPVWSVNARAAISDQIASVGGVDYWGSWNGDVHATDQSTGRQLWKAQLGSETNHHCYPAHIGIVSSPEVATVPVAGVPTQVVFIGGGNGRFYALDARTGRTIWSDFFGSPSAGYFLWSSPALFRGNLYFGVASVGSCPNIPGELVEADPSTGAIEASLPTSPAGCVGAGVWELPHDRHLQRQHLLRDRQRLRVLPAA